MAYSIESVKHRSLLVLPLSCAILGSDSLEKSTTEYKLERYDLTSNFHELTSTAFRVFLLDLHLSNKEESKSCLTTRAFQTKEKLSLFTLQM